MATQKGIIAGGLITPCERNSSQVLDPEPLGNGHCDVIEAGTSDSLATNAYLYARSRDRFSRVPDLYYKRYLCAKTGQR